MDENQNLLEKIEALKGQKLRGVQLSYSPQRKGPVYVILAFDGGSMIRFTCPENVEVGFEIKEEIDARSETQPSHQP